MEQSRGRAVEPPQAAARKMAWGLPTLEHDFNTESDNRLETSALRPPCRLRGLAKASQADQLSCLETWTPNCLDTKLLGAKTNRDGLIHTPPGSNGQHTVDVITTFLYLHHPNVCPCLRAPAPAPAPAQSPICKDRHQTLAHIGRPVTHYGHILPAVHPSQTLLSCSNVNHFKTHVHPGTLYQHSRTYL